MIAVLIFCALACNYGPDNTKQHRARCGCVVLCHIYGFARHATCALRGSARHCDDGAFDAVVWHLDIRGRFECGGEQIRRQGAIRSDRITTSFCLYWDQNSTTGSGQSNASVFDDCNLRRLKFFYSSRGAARQQRQRGSGHHT